MVNITKQRGRALMRMIKFCSLVPIPFLLSCIYPTADDISRIDFEERMSVWQYLSVYSLYQDRVPAANRYLTPYDMFGMISDSLGNGRYTEYIDDRSGGGVRPPPSFSTPVIVTDSTIYVIIPTFSDESLDFFMHRVSIFAHYPNIIIDLRNNGGGLLHVADKIIGEFLWPATRYANINQRIYSDKNRKGTTINTTMKTMTTAERLQAGLSGNPRLAGKRIAVLMNRWSASASEVMAAALKDCAGAALVGETSYGKGIGQMIISRANRKTLSITSMQISGIGSETGHYHKIGINADPVIEEYMEIAKEEWPEDPHFYYAALLLEVDALASQQLPRKAAASKLSANLAQLPPLPQPPLPLKQPAGAYIISEPDPLGLMPMIDAWE